MNTSTTPPSGYTYQATLGYLRLQPPASGGTITLTYDTGTNGKGGRTGMTDLAGSTSYTYDALGRPTQVTRWFAEAPTQPYTTTTTYTAFGTVATLTAADGEKLVYEYDGGGKVAVVRNDGGAIYASNIQYNAAGQITNLTYGNGVARTQTYELATQRLASLLTTRTGTTLQNLSYQYDGVGNLRTLTDQQNSVNTQTFLYDDRNRLTSATGAYGPQTFDYTAIGNIQTKAGVSYGYGAAGQTCGRLMPHAVTSTSDGKNYSYDCNGNTLSDGDRTFAWDADNRPVSVARTGVGTTTFTYNGDGARVKKAGPTKTIRYAGGIEHHIIDGVQVKHIGIGGLRLATTVLGGINAGAYSVHGDHLGSLNVLTNSSGTEVQRLTYRPFGETHTNDGTVDFDQHRYTGQEQDPETGLYYYGARYYNPGLGRFISADSLVPDPGDPQTLSRYSYVRNSPVNLVDHSGYYDADPDGSVSEGGDAPGATGLSSTSSETEGGGLQGTPTSAALAEWTAHLDAKEEFDRLNGKKPDDEPVEDVPAAPAPQSPAISPDPNRVGDPAGSPSSPPGLSRSASAPKPSFNFRETFNKNREHHA